MASVEDVLAGLGERTGLFEEAAAVAVVEGAETKIEKPQNNEQQRKSSHCGETVSKRCKQHL